MRIKIAFFASMALMLSACQTVNLDGPGPEKTGGYLVDYSGCRVGADFFSKGSPGLHRSNGGYGLRHDAIDFHSDLFVPVLAAAPGYVIQLERDCLLDDSCGESHDAGAYVWLEHRGFVTGYMHLERIPKSLSVGDYVSRGDIIGRIGMTGATRHPHLHWPVRTSPNGRLLNGHSMWHVPKEDIERKIVKMPFYDPNKKYEHDHLLTSPLRKEDCVKRWTTEHPISWRNH